MGNNFGSRVDELPIALYRRSYEENIVSYIFHVSQMNSSKIEYVVNQFYIINFSLFRLTLILDICVSLTCFTNIHVFQNSYNHESERNRVTQFHRRFE